jgi:hypothetical protein
MSTPVIDTEDTMSKLMISLLAAAGIAFAGGVNAADSKTMSRDAYKADKDKIEAQYKVDKEHCASMSGNGKDVCQAEAKGKEKVAKAELEANYKNTDKARNEAREARADADYDVAKEKCDDMSGNQKDVCVKQAKAAHTKAKADSKVANVSNKTSRDATEKRADARKEARDDTRDAQYKVAVEKCDAMSGAAKDQCVKDAKAHFGKT